MYRIKWSSALVLIWISEQMISLPIQFTRHRK